MIKAFMACNIPDGTGRYCFDMFGGKKFEDGTGRHGTVGVNFLDGTGRYRTMTVLFHDGTGR